jgi:aminomethyltransferase
MIGLGYRALRESAARIDLARPRIKVTGEDRARLLHAMSTNHVQQLQPGQGCYAFFLTAQGRILADANLLCFEDHFLLDCEPETVDKLYAHLDKFIIADDVTLEMDTRPGAAIEGPRAAEILGADPSQPESSWTELDGRTVARLSMSGQLGYRIIGDAGLAGLPNASAEDILAVRLENGKPRYGEDIFDTTLPQETQLSHALHFSKGCYIGQEIVERIRSRGQVKWLLSRMRIQGTEPPQRGARIMAQEKEAGEITSAAYSPAFGEIRALGYVRAEYLRAALKVNGASADTL